MTSHEVKPDFCGECMGFEERLRLANGPHCVMFSRPMPVKADKPACGRGVRVTPPEPSAVQDELL